MKILGLVGAFGLGTFLVVSCNSGPVTLGCRLPTPVYNPSSGLCERATTPGTGGTNGTGGTGGSGGGTGEGACTNMDDTSVYMDLEYGMEMGSAAASAAASDCVFGTSFQEPTEETGCAPQAGVILGCQPNCSASQVAALSDCVVDCMQGIIAEQTGSMLTEDCGDCYGASVACSAVNCAAFCAAPTSSGCIQCRCDNDCTPGFDRCSGLPPSGACN